MTTLTDLDPFNGLEPFSDVNPWEAQARAEREALEAARKTQETEREDQGQEGSPDASESWKDMTKRPMDWQRHMATLDISKPAKILGMVMSHFCGPNSHGCSASIDTLAERSGLSRRAADRAVKELRDSDLIRSVGTGRNWVKVYRLGIPN